MSMVLSISALGRSIPSSLRFLTPSVAATFMRPSLSVLKSNAVQSNVRVRQTSCQPQKTMPYRSTLTTPPSLSQCKAIAALRAADCVCFDVDSTVIDHEGIDVLAAYCGVGDQVKNLTSSAMSGSLPFEVALKQRLDLIKPTLAQVRSVASRPVCLTPGIAHLIERFQNRGTDVYLLSGGFTQMIKPVADVLHIPHDRVIANTLLFNDRGEYSGFDTKAPTSKSGGKPAAIHALRLKHKYNTIVMFGDGSTDLEAKSVVDAFVGYGGIAERDVVKANADWYVYCFEDVTSVV